MNLTWPEISDDGNFVLFSSRATNLVSGDTNNEDDLFVYERQTCQTERVTVASDGTQANGTSFLTDIAPDGSEVLFYTTASNLAPGFGLYDGIIHNRLTGTTTVFTPSVVAGRAYYSMNGAYIIFRKAHRELSDTTDLYVYNRQNAEISPVLLAPSGVRLLSSATNMRISDDGRFIAFTTHEDVVPGEDNDSTNVFLNDRQTQQTIRVSVASNGAYGNSGSYLGDMSADGRFVLFTSLSSNFTTSDNDNWAQDIFVRDTQAGTTTQISLDYQGKHIFYEALHPRISADGRFIAFYTLANLTPDDVNGYEDIYLYDRLAHLLVLSSRNTAGLQGNLGSMYPAISNDGKYVGFSSLANNLVADDTNGTSDFFLKPISSVYVTFTVNTTNDTDDSVCDGNHCSLREAINAANTSSPIAVKSIIFDIPGTEIRTVQPASALPAITTSIIIDGTTQPGYAVGAPVIQLDGTNAGNLVNGLVLEGGGSTVRGLVINRFKANGILIKTVGGNTIEGNFIGTDAAGTVDLGNNLNGIQIESSPNNIIGGTTVVTRNVISGNENGIYILNATSTGNRVQGSYIGTNAAGTSAIGNTNFGVVVSAGASTNTIGGTAAGAGNLISGNNPTSAMLGGAGVGLGNTGNIVQGNKIGTDVTGTQPIGNGFAGIWIENATNSIIGGTNGSPNIIAFNNGDGVYFSFTNGTPTGNQITTNSIFANTGLGIDLGNTDGVTPNDTGDGDTGANNLQNFPVLSGIQWVNGDLRVGGTLNSAANTSFRIEFFTSTSCDSSGNGEGKTYLGFANVTTNGTGNVTFIDDMTADISSSQVITATATDSNNNTSEFSGCAAVPVPPPAQAGPTFIVNTTADVDDGVCGIAVCTFREAIDAANANSDLSTINFNISGSGVQTIQPVFRLPYITSPVIIDGTTQPGYAVGAPVIELDGTIVADGDGGLVIMGGGSTIRGLVINRFNSNGIVLTGHGGNTITGNYIGTDVTGTLARPNGQSNAGTNPHTANGIYVHMSSSNNIIGGKTLAQRNVISGNFQAGIMLWGSNNKVIGNLLGTNAAGTEALGNVFGIGVWMSNNNIIGGADAGAANIISGNSLGGMEISGSGNIVQGNYVGTDITGTLDLGNAFVGISIAGNSAFNNTIGGTVSGAGNIIAFNATIGPGVGIDGTATTTGNAILGNSIFENGSLGIDIVGSSGVMLNDVGDADTGANNLQNFPVLSTGGTSGTGTNINGTLNSQPNKIYRLEFFANTACDPSGYGEGQTYLGFTNVTTDNNGDVDFSADLTAMVVTGQFITATATDPNNNTSEFSACIPVTFISVPNAAPNHNYFTTASVPLSWQGVTWAVGYEIVVDNNADFSSPEYADSSLASSAQSITTSPLDEGMYYWRVGAKKTNGSIAWSAVQSFTLEVP